jgi:osmotically-inducible protein OsmY
MAEVISDANLLRTVNDRLSRVAGSAMRDLRLTISNGTVTLMGALRFDNQRRTFLKAVNTVAGVRTVIDKMTVAAVRNKK